MNYFFNNFISPSPTLDESSDEDKLYTTKEAAKELGVSEYTIRKKIRDGDLKAEKMKGEAGYRITRKEIERFSEVSGKSGITLKKAKSIVPSVGSVVTCTVGTTPAIIGGFVGGLISLKDLLFKRQKENNNLGLDEKIDQNKEDISFLEALKEGLQKDLNFADLNLQRLNLDKDELGDTKEFKKKELDIQMGIEHIGANIQAIDMRITDLEKENKELMKKE